MGEANFLQTSMATEYWEALEQSEALALHGMGYFESTFASLRK